MHAQGQLTLHIYIWWNINIPKPSTQSQIYHISVRFQNIKENLTREWQDRLPFPPSEEPVTKSMTCGVVYLLKQDSLPLGVQIVPCPLKVEQWDKREEELSYLEMRRCKLTTCQSITMHGRTVWYIPACRQSYHLYGGPGSLRPIVLCNIAACTLHAFSVINTLLPRLPIHPRNALFEAQGVDSFFEVLIIF